MDPNAAWANLMDPIWDLGTRIEAGYALLNWLERGGFVPADMPVARRSDAIREVNLHINSLEDRRG